MTETDYLDLALPWSGRQREDRRFRRILGSTLAAFVVLAGVVSNLPPPPMAEHSESDLPPRIAYVIGDQHVSSAGGAVSGEQLREAPSKKAPPKASAHGDLTPPSSRLAAQLTARQKAARSGVLAFSDALKGLREAAPELVAASAIEVGGNKAAENSNGDSLLVAGLSRGSGGIDGDIPGHGEGSGIGGFAGLPGGRGEGRGAIARAGPAGSRVGAQPGGRPQRRPSRSQEEIQEILDRNKSRMYALYNRELRIHPALQGKVVVNITIAPSGRVTECRIVYSELDAASLESKLILLIKRIDFGDKPKVPVVTTRVPIEFFPA